MASFGDDHVLVERYVTRPRHIEIQVFGDTHGNYVHLFERDCSVQRRHQKVLEEAPAPGMTASAAPRWAPPPLPPHAVWAMWGLGQWSSLPPEQSGQFYFMEMNTRLQVEHPVTEAITGLDLVEWQLRVAAGEPLPKQQHELAIRGHAIEARICAENPANQFLPATGKMNVYRTPTSNAFQVAPVRVDSGVREGDEITPYYDSMIAKLIVWGHNREQALAQLDAALSEMHITGLTNNVAFLRRIVSSQAFSKADLDTALIEREREHLFAAPDQGPAATSWTVAAIMARQMADEAQHTSGQQDAWNQHDGWRVHGMARRHLQLDIEGQRLTAVLSYVAADQFELQVNPAGPDTASAASQTLRIRRPSSDRFELNLGAQRRTVSVYRDGAQFHHVRPSRPGPSPLDRPLGPCWRRPQRQRQADRADARSGRGPIGASWSGCAGWPARSRDRSHENGTHAQRTRRWRRHRSLVRCGRSGAGGCRVAAHRGRRLKTRTETPMLPTQVKLVDVGPRDGLQNEATPIATEHKIELIHRLQSRWPARDRSHQLRQPQVGAPDGDNSAVMAGIQRQAGVRYSVLTPT